MLTVRCRGRLLPVLSGRRQPIFVPAWAPPLWFPICSYLNKKMSFSGLSLLCLWAGVAPEGLCPGQGEEGEKLVLAPQKVP